MFDCSLCSLNNFVYGFWMSHTNSMEIFGFFEEIDESSLFWRKKKWLQICKKILFATLSFKFQSYL